MIKTFFIFLLIFGCGCNIGVSRYMHNVFVENLTAVIKALSDGNRLKILSLLRKKSLCVCEIESLLALAQPTISTHLKVLVNAKLIKSEKRGTWIIYHLISDQLPMALKQIVASSLEYLGDSPKIKELFKKQRNLKIRPKCNI